MAAALIYLAGIWVAGLTSAHPFLAKSSHALNGLNFDQLPPAEVVTLLRSNVYIPCSSQLSSAEISWTKNNLAFTKQTAHKFPNGTLYISKVSEDDVGVYRCLLTAHHYTIGAPTTQLSIADESELWEWTMPKHLVVAEGSVVRLQCGCRHHVAISWTKDHRPILPNNQTMYTPWPGILHIMYFTKDQSGTYRCEARFGDGVVVGPASQLTFAPATISERANEIEEKYILRPSAQLRALSTPMIVKAVEGGEALLECISNDPKLAAHTWKRFDSNVISVERSRLVAQGSLLISAVTSRDASAYKCVSSQGDDDEEKEEVVLSRVRLVVQRGPRVNLTDSLTVANGLHTRFNCTVEGMKGMPEASVQLLKNGLELKNDFNTMIKKIETAHRNVVVYMIELHYVWKADEGVYQCIASNVAGAASEASVLRIEKVHLLPSPRHVTVTHVTPSSMMFEWAGLASFSPASKHQGYIMRFFSLGKTPKEQVVGSNVTRKQYSDLDPDTDYTFIIYSYIARNTTMNISEPRLLLQTTKAVRPSRSPDIEMRMVEDTLKLSWQSLSPLESGGQILDQKIQWTTQLSNPQMYQEHTLAADMFQYSIPGVDPDKLYHVRILPRNKMGYPLDGKWSQLELYAHNALEAHQAVDKSMPVQLCLTSNDLSTILMKWTHFAKLESQTYAIQLTHENGLVQHMSVAASKKQLLVRKLEPGCYSVALTVVSAALAHINASASICTQVRGVYSDDIKYRLYKSEADTYTTDTISVSWSPYYYQFFIVEINRIQYLTSSSKSQHSQHLPGLTIPADQRQMDAENCFTLHPTICHSVDHDVFYEIIDTSGLIVNCVSVNLTHLLPATTYRIRVVAATFNVTGTPSSPLFVTTLEGVPSEPRDVRSEVLTTSSVNISWSIPSQLNGRLVKYELAYSMDQHDWTIATIPPHTHFYEIRGLVSNTFYHLKLAASTSTGRSESVQSVVCIPAELKAAMSAEMIGLCVISMFVVVTCVVLAYLCSRMYRMRRAAIRARQVNYTPQVIYLNDDKQVGSEGDHRAHRPNAAALQHPNTLANNTAMYYMEPHPDQDCTLSKLLASPDHRPTASRPTNSQLKTSL